MAASNQTSKGFPQWEGTDRLAIRGDLNAAFATMDDELVQTDGKIATLENEGSSLRATVADVNTRLGVAVSTLDSVDDAVAEVDSRLGDAIANVDSRLGDAIANVDSRLGTAVSTLDSVGNTVADVDTRLGATVSTLDSVSNTVDTLQSTQTLHGTQISGLNTAVSNTNGRIVPKDDIMRYLPGSEVGSAISGYDANMVERTRPSMVPIVNGVNTPSTGLGVLETIPYSNDWAAQYFHEMYENGGGVFRRTFYEGTTWSEWTQL